MTTVSSKELADLLGLKRARLGELAGKGFLTRVGHGRFDLETSIKNYVQHLREVAAGRTSNNEDIDAVLEGALLKRSQREINELKKAEIERRVIPIEQLTPAWGRVATATRAAVLAIPGKARFELPHLTAHDAETIDGLCRDALTSASMVMTAPEADTIELGDDDIGDDAPAD